MTYYDVFISYSTRDNGEEQGRFITSIKDSMESAGLEVWMDATDMETGMEWWPQIETHIERSDNFVFIVSPNSLNSEWCHKEIAHARNQAKRTISVVYQPVDPRELLAGWFEKPFEASARENLTYLRRGQWLDEYSRQAGSLQALIDRLLFLAQNDLECIKAHTQLVLQTSFWVNNGRSPSIRLQDEVLVAAEARLKACGGKIEAGKIEFSKEQRTFIAESRRIENDEIEKEARKQRLIRLLQISSLIFVIVALVALVATAFAARQLAFAEFRERVTSALNERVVGSSSYLIGNFAGAVTQYQNALEILNPDQQPWKTFTEPQYVEAGADISAWLNDLGRVCAQQREYDCAIDAFQDAIEVNAENANPYLNLANIYSETEQLDEARQVLQTLEASGVDGAEAIHLDRMMAAVEYASGNYELALELLDKWRDALKPRPNDEGAEILSAFYLDMVYYTALSYEGLEDHETACRYWAEFQAARLRVPPNQTLVFWFNDKSTEANEAFTACDLSTNSEGA
jgi:tetratricopeptide (TPR) repeat protein